VASFVLPFAQKMSEVLKENPDEKYIKASKYHSFGLAFGVIHVSYPAIGRLGLGRSRPL
jgi:hypothetical protein